MKKYFYLILIIVLTFSYLYAEKISNINKLKKAPKIDGNIQKDEWSDATSFNEFYQTSPGNNCEPSEKTEVYLGYTEEKLFFLVKAYVKNKNTLRAYHHERDNISRSDRVYFYFDTYNSNNKAYFFGANVFGDQSDGIIKDHHDTSIDIDYKSKGRVTSYGYLIEFSVPFDSIKYQSGENIKWKFMFERRIPAKSEKISCFKVDRNISNYFENYQYIIFKKLTAKQHLSLIPAYTGHYDIKYDTSDNKTEDYYDKKELNIFYEPNSNFSLKFVLNPDFSFIESDAMKIDVNSRFSTYYSEKRPFFIEQDITYDPPIEIFYTRKIFEPKAGIKITGEKDNFQIYGITSIIEDVPVTEYYNQLDEESNISDTYYGFFSLSKNIKNNAKIRSSFTYRNFDNFINSVFSFDGFYRKNNFEFVGQVVSSFDEKLNKKTTKGFGYFAGFDYEINRFNFDLNIKALDKNFKPDLGYITDTDKSSISGDISYNYNSQTDEKLVDFYQVRLGHSFKYDYSYQNLNEWEIEPSFEISLNNIWLQVSREENMYKYNQNKYRTYQNEFRTSINGLKFINFYIELKQGKNLFFNENSFVDNYFELEASVNISPFAFLNIDYDYNYQKLKNAYTANINEIETKLQFINQIWFRIILQREYYEMYNDGIKAENYNIYPLLTYNPNANTAIYLGYNDIDNSLKENNIIINDEKKDNYFIKIKYKIDIL